MSTLAPFPALVMSASTSSTVEYDMHQRDGSIPSLTLSLHGNERSVIS